ncbi:hypothetical protein T492DRAFT_1039433 [Pavlovales sp. CCMP2436]|nr:hypothetical protein T492DRAFT_1039433 [Pavlovales sp. CCMP2436]
MWGASSAPPAWLAQLERDAPELTELAVLRPLDAATWSSVSLALAKSTRLRTLIAHKALTPEVLRELADGCSTSQLESVSVGTQQLGDEGAAILLPALARCPTLLSCDLEARGLGDASADGIVSLILGGASPAHLHSLTVARNDGLTPVAIQKIAGAVASSQLTRLDVSSLGLGAEGAGALGQMCASAQRLERLVIKSADLGVGGAAAFAHAMASPAVALRAIDLSDVALGAGAAALLAALTARAPALTSLNLDRATGVAEALSSIGGLLGLPLRTLSVQGCALGDEGARLLSTAISERCPPLERLHIGSNGIHGESLVMLLVAHSRLPTAKLLDCLGNPLGDEGAGKLAEAIRADPRGAFGHLASVSLSACEIGKSGFAALEQALTVCAQPSADAAPITLECAQNPACNDDEWSALVDRLRAARPELQLVWLARGGDEATQSGGLS